MVQHVYSIARIRLGKESLSKTHTINNNDFLGSLVDSSLGSKVVGTGSLDSGLVDGDNGSVGVSNKAVAVSGTVAVRSNSSSGVESASKATSGSKVVGTGSSNGGLVSGDDGTVGVGDQVGVQVQGAGVAVADSRDSSDGGGNGRSSNGRSSNGRSSNGYWSNGGVLGSPGGKVVGTGSSNCWLVHRDDGTVGVTNQAVLGGREGNTRGENQELHCCLQLCA